MIINNKQGHNIYINNHKNINNNNNNNNDNSLKKCQLNFIDNK